MYYTVESELFNKRQSLVKMFVSCFMDVVQHQLSLGSRLGSRFAISRKMGSPNWCGTTDALAYMRPKQDNVILVFEGGMYYV